MTIDLYDSRGFRVAGRASTTVFVQSTAPDTVSVGTMWLDLSASAAGSGTASIREAATSSSVTTSDQVVWAAGGTTQTLPDPSTASGYVFTVVNSSETDDASDDVTVDVAAAGTISGEDEYVLGSREAIVVACNGTEYRIQ